MLQLFVVGRLGKDATINQVKDKSVINFSVAVDTGYGDNKKTEWIDCAKWGDKTTVAQYLTKGTQVAILGELSTRTYDKADGTKGFSIVVRVDKLDLLGGKQQGEGQQQAATAAANEPSEDLPF